ncbi:MAG: DUF1638 domain-containing protein [Firmicutes bacterium]|nr:DUF1638 domain-containing protein [Bacillota bacterium]
MRSLVITCATIRAELEQVIKKTQFKDPVLYLESGLHNNPKKLHAVMQEILARIDNVDQVLIVMGYCGNAVLDLQAHNYRMIIPRADDCLTMLLGSQARRQEVQQEKQTYFFSKGWLQYFDNLEKDIVTDLTRMEARYGKERAEKIFRSMFKHYKRAGVIDTGIFDIDELMLQAREKAQTMQLDCEVIPGTTDFLAKFLTGPWESDNFIIINAGETVLYKHLFASASTA